MGRFVEGTGPFFCYVVGDLVKCSTGDEGIVGCGGQEETDDAVVVGGDEEGEVVGGEVGEGGGGDDETGSAAELVCRRWR